MMEGKTVARMKREVGYCHNTDCDDYGKGYFLLNHAGDFFCPKCRKPGQVEREIGSIKNKYPVFKEVRIEFNYDPVNRRYREVAIVRDESLWGQCNTYTLHSPLICTDKRALKVAESMLANLNRYSGTVGDEIPASNEIILDLAADRDRYFKHLKELGDMWTQSPLAKEKRR